MKRIIDLVFYWTLNLFLLVGVVNAANPEAIGEFDKHSDVFSDSFVKGDLRYFKEKRHEASYNVSSSDRLSIDNKHGDVTLIHWKKKEVKIDVDITVRNDDEKMCDKILERINISTEKKNGVVYGITKTAPMNSNDFGGSFSFSIDYTVYLPEKMDFSIELKYGNLKFPFENNGKNCNFNIKYGSMEGGGIDNFKAKVGYGNISVRDCQNINLDISFSANQTRIENVKNLVIDSKYSTFLITKVTKLDLKSAYDNFQIEKMLSGECEMKYSKMTLDYLDKSLVCPTFTYGELNIKDVAKNFQEIDINAKFSSVKINIGKGSSFKVDAANYKYGHCKVSGFNSVENNIHYEGGYVSTGNSKDEVKLNVNGGKGGSIKFDGGSFSSLSVKGK
jgi:hypothetical protein